MSFLSNLFGPPVPGAAPQEIQARLKASPAPFVLDVREPVEYRSGHIAGARLIPLGEVPRRLHEIPRDREIILICASGHRSLAAARTLVPAGYKVLNLQGGMLAWHRAKLPVTKR